MAQPPSPAAMGAAQAAGDVVKSEREALDASRPMNVNGSVQTKKLQMVSEAAVDVLKALDGPKIPAWKAPKGVRDWTEAVPVDIYRVAMMILTLIRKVLPPELGAQFDVVPQDFTTDEGLDKIAGMLALIAKDKKLQKAIEEGASKMGAAPTAQEAAEPGPNPDAGAPPHAEPDEDDYVDAGSAPM